MKLNIVPASEGAQWVKQGIQTFFRQPLALSGLFFMFMAIVSVLSIVPFLGSLLALVILPACTLGLMAATREAVAGKFPMPSIMASAFRAGKAKMRSMLVLGVVYALGVLLVMGASALADGGQFARLYLLGGTITREMVMEPAFQSAMWVALILYTPLSMLFWHAPALVHWHDMPPVKSLFFSGVVCLRNFRAFLVFGLVWMVIFLLAGVMVTLLATVIGGPEIAGVAMFPAAMLMAAMFFTSIFFTYQASFETPEGSAP
ncbi:MAG TPA: BPSS1780 family membrane protein [Burkholderiaceae bacterium]|nr:BPSS1780 family membrane protein [Burkholderiaceae bacterium]